MSQSDEMKARDLETAVQIWCEPQHAKKVMDVDFARSIAVALASERQKQKMRDAKIVEGYRVIHHAEHVWGVGESERNRVCSHLAQSILSQENL